MTLDPVWHAGLQAAEVQPVRLAGQAFAARSGEVFDYSEPSDNLEARLIAFNRKQQTTLAATAIILSRC